MHRRGRYPATRYAGVCTDVKGEDHWLVLGERSVKFWLGGRLLETAGDGRHYYEVISDAGLIDRVRKKLSGDAVAGPEN